MTIRIAALRVLPKLGWMNVLRVLKHRVFLKLGVYRCYSPAEWVVDPEPEFFSSVIEVQKLTLPPRKAWQKSAVYFSWFQQEIDEPPDWFVNPFNGSRLAEVDRHWSEISEAGLPIGDIKTLWEASRFEWVISFAQQAKLGDEAALQRLNEWLADWSEKNPAWNGPNWLCGQETAIRVMHLATAALILDEAIPLTEPLKHLLRLHLERISQTLGYALAQDNNHGTSEAAALFIGGHWLLQQGDASDEKQGAKWAAIGRHWLEERAQRLMFSDGGFSQYSINYHRLMMETYSLCELWRRKAALPTFSADLHQRLVSATYWLYAMVLPESGAAPNIGANDGANLLPLTDADYTDHRPAVQLAMVLFCDRIAYEATSFHRQQLDWLGLSLPMERAKPSEPVDHESSGFAVLRNEHVRVLLRYPRFRFRPSQSDALHVDFWWGANNVLRDAGSYSYNPSERWHRYFSGVAAHNTIQFDDRDQMPRISRFLFADWLQTDYHESITQENGVLCCAAGYTDRYGASHRRRICLEQTRMTVEDEVAGFERSAILRWRLQPLADEKNWVLQGNTVSGGGFSITLSSDMAFDSIAIKEGWESRYYLQKAALPVLEVCLSAPGKITTTMTWGNDPSPGQGPGQGPGPGPGPS